MKRCKLSSFINDGGVTLQPRLFDKEQLNLLLRCREAYEKVRRIPEHKEVDYGNRFEEIAKEFMIPHVPPKLKLVCRAKIRAHRLYTTDLALIKDSAFRDNDHIPAQSIHAVIEVRGFGIVARRGQIPQALERKGFYQISKMFPHIRGAYLAIKEREAKEPHHIDYVKETRDFLGDRAFILSEGDHNYERKPYRGEWKRFLDYVTSG